ncbi:hypothetical protein IGA_04869 [Bacillus cereus HuA3-9]|uniref:Integrase catalytic domain-containing protein n=1 Tax=Bacillus cereus HuA3-9 TaxID=1053205 RepID=R8CM52_BACCE|nr:hypothetical protein IGA_04869 [Bacillus cereus HuA3-9]
MFKKVALGISSLAVASVVGLGMASEASAGPAAPLTSLSVVKVESCIESFFSHFKSEMFYLNYYQTKEELIQAIETYIYHYNYKRFQKRLNHRAPIEYRISMAA